MSYETENFLPVGVSAIQAAKFALLLGYVRAGTYAHMGSPKTLSLIHFEETDYRSWQAVELSISTTESGVVVGTRTRVGRSTYDFQFQNRTVAEFKRRFGGKASKDGPNGEGYNPGPAVTPAASGCYLSMRRFDWHFSRLQRYLMARELPKSPEGADFSEKTWPVMLELNPEVFSNNVLVPYLVSMLEEYFRSSYIALLRYSEKKQAILKGVRLSGEQLVSISNKTLSVEEAVAETLPFQRLSAVARHFKELDPKLDLIGALKKPYRGRKKSLFESLDALTTQRHALVHGMEIDITLRGKRLDSLVANVAASAGRSYRHITEHYGWFKQLNGFAEFSSHSRA